MASVPPPQGMSEVDYEAIEAAVTETVRGRWFLSEFARRNRAAESRQLLDAMARLEAAVTAGPASLPSADPSIRLLIQRIKEIAGQLRGVAGEMRAAGVEDRYVEAVDGQARAVSGMMRSASLPAGATPKPPEPPKPSLGQAPAPRTPREDLSVALAPRALAAAPSSGAGAGDNRLTTLADIDALPLAKKLAIFT